MVASVVNNGGKGDATFVTLSNINCIDIYLQDSVPPPYDEATKGTASAVMRPINKPSLLPPLSISLLSVDSHLVPSQGGEREAPPTYDQLFGVSELRDAKRESSNHATFAVKFCQVISGTGKYTIGSYSQLCIDLLLTQLHVQCV